MLGWWEVGALIIIGTLLWIGAGRWELHPGPQCQSRISEWKDKWFRKGQTYVWKIEERDVARDFWHVRKEIPQLEEELRTRIYVQLSLQELPELDSRAYQACLQRRFPDLPVDLQDYKE